MSHVVEDVVGKESICLGKEQEPCHAGSPPGGRRWCETRRYTTPITQTQSLSRCSRQDPAGVSNSNSMKVEEAGLGCKSIPKEEEGAGLGGRQMEPVRERLVESISKEVEGAGLSSESVSEKVEGAGQVLKLN